MTDLEIVRRVYEQFPARVAKVRKMFGRPLTLAEKVLGAHLCDLDGPPPKRLETTVDLAPDRVAMQDATAQMAILQFMRSGRRRTAVPTTVHCDHLIRAEQGARDDMLVALDENHEVYAFLGSASLKYGMGFWKPGSGIIHQVVLENYAFPGGMMIGTDSHTPNAGGLGMIAIGVGGADAVDVMVGEPFGLLWPGVIGVRLTGQLGGWTSPKDIILKLMGILTVKGGTNCIVEFFGPGTTSVSATGKGTVCNMGAEHGATTSVFPYDERMATYLRATGRAEIARLADGIREHLTADPEAIAQPERFYDRIIEIDLSTLEPMIVGPHSPDVARPISQMARDVREQDYPDEFTYGLIGSCTNSSYEDMDRAALVARQAREKGLKLAKPLLVTPGSDQIHNTIQRDGQTAVLEEVGATVLANACGPCIGQWRRTDPAAGKRNSILNSYNRNFKRRNDGSAETLSFIGSPEIVTALTFAGRLSFNPLTDSLRTPDGREFRFSPPAEAAELPQRGFAEGLAGYQKPADDPDRVLVIIDPGSERLQALEPFPAWEGTDLTGLVLLLQAEGKCTTDHISAAGPWLKYRGHLDRISDNAFLGAVNRFGGESGIVKNTFTGERAKCPAVARDYKRRGAGWVVVGDQNYGEGSSREHAAMTPRYLGCRAVIVRSFARIHETNLKKQGVLPLIFSNPADFDRFREDDRIDIIGVTALAPRRPLQVVLHHRDGGQETFEVTHTLTEKQIEWFKAGSALNAIASAQQK